jgi:transposase-like protein
MEHRLVYEKFGSDGECCILPRIIIHHKNEIKDDNRPENLMPVPRSKHMKIHNPRQDFGALCRSGSRDVRGFGRQNDRQRFHCEDCNEYWSIPIPELEIMLKEYESGLREFSIKNPRTDVEVSGVKCVFCGSIDIVRNGIRNEKQLIKCNICNKSWRILMELWRGSGLGLHHRRAKKAPIPLLLM